VENLEQDRIPQEGMIGVEAMFVTVMAERIGDTLAVLI
jgi:hypothetical protein